MPLPASDFESPGRDRHGADFGGIEVRFSASGLLGAHFIVAANCGRAACAARLTWRAR
jgi:hypothetical protein